MPAIQLARLKDQISQMAWSFTRPDEFTKQLRALLDLYSDRTYRPGHAVRARPLIPAYHVPVLVIRQLEQSLGRLSQENPDAALLLVDELWKDDYLEPRLLAASLLGQLPLTPPEPVLERMLSWNQPDLERRVLEALMLQGSARLRREAPERWLVLVEHWLSDLDPQVQTLGVKALLPIIQDREFENLPRIFRLLGPLVQNVPAQFQLELQQDLEALARRSPAETVYFLRQMLSLGNSIATTRLVRRCLPAFNEETQESLRRALLSRPQTSGSDR